MKNKILSFICFIICSCILCSCSKDDDKLMFNKDKSYIYFSLPFKIDSYGRQTNDRLDSLSYSFAFDGSEVTDYTFKIPVSIAGVAANTDRTFKVEVVEEDSNIADSDWDKSVIEAPIIHKGILFDTLVVKVNRTESIKDAIKSITFRLLPNENFALSDSIYSTAKISFTDILLAPDYWQTYQSIFGDFCPEVYLKWREIYKEGADPKGYSWKKMPRYPYASWYPVTFLYITVLRDYFEENVVYPYGDDTKPRIRINY